jgi:hypothetical protein
MEINDYYTYFCQIPEYATLTDRGIRYMLTAAITPGIRVLIWKESPNELYDMQGNMKEFSKRLYTIYKFNNRGSDTLYLLPHITEEQGAEITFVASNFNCLIEHRDFEVDVLGNIILSDK